MDDKQKGRTFMFVGVGLFALALWFVWNGLLGSDSFDSLPSGGTSITEEVSINGEVREISVTDGVKHSVPLDEIVSGGPAKDAIPAIDDPKFVSVADAVDSLDDSDPGIALTIGDTARFYPYQILVWHEIVNDTFPQAGPNKTPQRVLVSYCPLCATGIAFDPLVNGERVEFGTSGRLWQSNLVMYDRSTDSMWSQVLGEAIVGEMTGTKLDSIPSDVVRFGEWRRKYPSGEVLSRDTGNLRAYGVDPYGGYYTNNDAIFFPLRNKDNRLEAKDFVLGIVIDEKAKAYDIEDIRRAGEFIDSFQGKTVIARWDSELEAAQLFELSDDGIEVRYDGVVAGYWFSWAATHPGTELYSK